LTSMIAGAVTFSNSLHWAPAGSVPMKIVFACGMNMYSGKILVK